MLPAAIAAIALSALGDWLELGTPTCGTPKAKLLIGLTALFSCVYSAAMAYGTGQLLKHSYPRLNLWMWVAVTVTGLTLLLTVSVWVPLCYPNESQDSQMLVLNMPALEALAFTIFLYFVGLVFGLVLGLPQGLVLRQSGARWDIWLIGVGVGLGLGFVITTLVNDALYSFIPSTTPTLRNTAQLTTMTFVCTSASAMAIRFMMRTKHRFKFD